MSDTWQLLVAIVAGAVAGLVLGSLGLHDPWPLAILGALAAMVAVELLDPERRRQG